jgi:hypothetical protein
MSAEACHEVEQVMSLRKMDGLLHQQRLEVLFDALLTMEADGVMQRLV